MPFVTIAVARRWLGTLDGNFELSAEHMSRQERRKAEREAAKAARKLGRQAGLASRPVVGLTPEMEYVFLLKDCVHVTDELIADLVSQGWPIEQLREFQENGGHFCPPRNSFVFSEPQGLEIILENGVLMDRVHELIVDGKPFYFSS